MSLENENACSSGSSVEKRVTSYSSARGRFAYTENVPSAEPRRRVPSPMFGLDEVKRILAPYASLHPAVVERLSAIAAARDE